MQRHSEHRIKHLFRLLEFLELVFAGCGEYVESIMRLFEKFLFAQSVIGILHKNLAKFSVGISQQFRNCFDVSPMYRTTCALIPQDRYLTIPSTSLDMLFGLKKHIRRQNDALS